MRFQHFLSKLIWRENYSKEFSASTHLKHFVIQKLLRINGKVPWPVHWTSTFKGIESIQRGTRYPGLSINCYLDARNGVIFGKNVWVGPNVSIISMNHDIYDYNKYIKSDPIKISDNCWIGANVTILPGVNIGHNTVVGAGAVVTKSFPEGDVVLGGNPASIIKRKRKQL